MRGEYKLFGKTVRLFGKSIHFQNNAEYLLGGEPKRYHSAEDGGETRQPDQESQELKAPNGKQSNLTPEQWRIIRTEDFKKWFGDWEDAYKYKAVQEIEPFKIKADNYSEEEAFNKYKNLDVAENKYNGNRIRFVNDAFKKIMKHKERENIIRIIPNLKEILETSVPIYDEIQRDKQQHSNIIGYNNYYNKVNINGEDNHVRFTVQKVKAKEITLKNGFIPNTIHNIFVSDIEIKRANESLSTISKIASTSIGSNTDLILQNWLDKVKTIFNNCSKLIDENGEPLAISLEWYKKRPDGTPLPSVDGTNIQKINTKSQMISLNKSLKIVRTPIKPTCTDNSGINELFSKSIGAKKPAVNTGSVKQGAEQERQEHKYIKREKDSKNPGKWIYYYKMPNGEIQASNDANPPAEAGAVTENAVKNGKMSGTEPLNEQTRTDSQNVPEQAAPQQAQPEIQQAQLSPEEQAELQKKADDPDHVDWKRIRKVYGLDTAQITNIENLSNNYKRKAEFEKSGFLRDVDDVFEEAGIKGTCPSISFGQFAVKGKNSIVDKCLRNIAKGRPDKNNEFSDILRTTIVINNVEQAKKLKSLLEKKGYEFLEDENLYSKQGAGYKHIAWKVKSGGSDLVKEILLTRPNMLAAKFGLGHGLYDVDKNIMKLMPTLERQKGLAASVGKMRNILAKYMDGFYEAAYYKDLAEEKGNGEDYQPFAVNEPSSRDSYSAATEPRVTKDTTSSATALGSLEVASSLAITSLIGSLNEIWEPISANFSTVSGVNDKRSAKAAKVDSIFSFIVEPLGKLHKKYAGNIINKSIRFKSILNYQWLIPNA